jgi:hypothetical protein
MEWHNSITTNGCDLQNTSRLKFQAIHIKMTTRFDPIQAAAFIGLGVAASALASRTVLKYKPDKVWKHIKQGECSQVVFEVLTVNECGLLLMKHLRSPCVNDG